MRFIITGQQVFNAKFYNGEPRRQLKLRGVHDLTQQTVDFHVQLNFQEFELGRELEIRVDRFVVGRNKDLLAMGRIEKVFSLQGKGLAA